MRVASVRASAGGAVASGGRREFHVAPMRDYTDRHLRRFTRLLSREAVLWSEMEKPRAILKAADASSSSKLDRLLRRGSDEGYEGFQIGGNDPATVAEATRLVLPYGYDELNLNCGCPAVASGGGDYGASLMRDGGDDAARVVEAMVRQVTKHGGDAHTKISVKCRVGIAETLGDVLSKDASAEEVRERLAEPLASFLAKCADAGASSAVVHCRQAVMSGLSPSKNRGVPPLRPELVFELCSVNANASSKDHRVPSKVILNGGVSSFADAARIFRRCPNLAGAQAGRWPLLRPFDALHVDAFLAMTSSDELECLLESRTSASLASHRSAETERFEFPFDRRAAARAAAAAEPYAIRSAAESRRDAGAGAAARPLALAIADLDDRLEASRASDHREREGRDDPDALAGALDGVLGVCGDLLGVDGGTDRAKRTRKALAKAVGKKVGGKQRGTRAEAAEAAGRVASGRCGGVG